MWVLGGDAVVYASRVADRRHRRESSQWQTVSKRPVMACRGIVVGAHERLKFWPLCGVVSLDGFVSRG